MFAESASASADPTHESVERHIETLEARRYPAGGFFDIAHLDPLEGARRRTGGDLAKLIKRTIPAAADSGSLALLDLMTDHVWEVLGSLRTRNVRQLQRTHRVFNAGNWTTVTERQCLENYMSLAFSMIGALHLWTNDCSPWYEPVVRQVDGDAKRTQQFVATLTSVLEHDQFHDLRLNNGQALRALTNLIHDVAITELHRLALPTQPDQFKPSVAIKTLRIRVTRLLRYRAELERYRQRTCDAVWDARALQACDQFDQRIIPLLTQIKDTLASRRPDMGRLHRELMNLCESIWLQETPESEIVRHFGQQQQVAQQETPISPSWMMGTLATTVLDAPLRAVSREGPILSIGHLLQTSQTQEEALLPPIEQALRCLKIISSLDLTGLTVRLAVVERDPASGELAFACRTGLRILNLIRTRAAATASSLEKRIAWLREARRSPTCWALTIRDILHETYAIDERRSKVGLAVAGFQHSLEYVLSPAGRTSINELGHIATFHFDALALARGPITDLLERCMAETDRLGAAAAAAAASVADGILSTGSPRRRPPRRTERPAAVAAEQKERQAPQLERPVEEVTIALLHDRLIAFSKDVCEPTFDADFRQAYARAIKSNLLHFLKQLNERTAIVGEERLHGDVDLLRRVLEAAIELAAAHFPMAGDDPTQSVLRTSAFRTHELHKLLRPVLRSEQIAPNVRGILSAHVEIVHVLSQANRCVNYPLTAAHEATGPSESDKRTRWLLGYLGIDFEPAEHQKLVGATLHLVAELVKGIQDSEYRAGDVIVAVDDETPLPPRPAEEEGEPPAAHDPGPIATIDGARFGLDAMISWIDLRQISPARGEESCREARNRALGHAALYLRRLRARMSQEERMERPCDTCWGEIDLAHRLTKELLLAALFHRGELQPALAHRLENNPFRLAEALGLKTPSLPPYLARAHAIISYPTNFSGPPRQGDLIEALGRADELACDLDPTAQRECVELFERRFIFPAVEAAWGILEGCFPTDLGPIA